MIKKQCIYSSISIRQNYHINKILNVNYLIRRSNDSHKDMEDVSKHVVVNHIAKTVALINKPQEGLWYQREK